MLQSIHDRSQGWIVWIIFGLIILTFALWGVQSYIGVNEQPAVAVVDGVKITQNQYQRALQQQRQRFQSMLGTSYDPKLFDTPAVRKNIAEELINDALLMKFIADSGMRVGERQIGETIVSFPQFQKDGKFSEEQFQNYLRGEGLSQDQFFYRLGNDLMREQVYRGIVSSGLRTAAETTNESRLLSQRRELGYMVFDHKAYLKDVKVSEQEIQEYYQANSQQFMTDEQVAVEYIELSLQKLAEQISVTDKEARTYFEQNKAQYIAPEQRRASHILIEVAKDADAAANEKARAKAEEILKQVRAGGDFAALAKKYSQDIGSAKQGGDLGYFVAGTMTKAFDDKVFSMKKGQVSDLVHTEFGYHIIKLTDIKREEKGFNQVKQEVTREFKKREAEKQYYDLSENLANIAYSSPDSLIPAADETGLKVNTTDLFARHSASGVLANVKVLESVFNPEVISTRQNEVIEISPEQMVVVRVKEHQPATVKPLQQVQAEISTLLQSQKAKEEARKQAEAVLAEIQAGKAPAKLAGNARVKWLEKGMLGRRDVAKADASILQTAFTLPKGNIPASGLATLRTGDVAVVVVTKVVDGDVNNTANDQNQQRVKQQDGQFTYSQLIAYLKSEADVTRNYDLLK